MLRNASLVALILLAARAASADAVLSCRWGDASSSVVYALVEEKATASTDVRALLQGAPLAAQDGVPPRFPSLSAAQPAHETPPLACTGGEPAAADGLLELTFTRRVRLGIEYTLGRCRLYYRCPPAAADGSTRLPERVLVAPSPSGAGAVESPSD